MQALATLAGVAALSMPSTPHSAGHVFGGLQIKGAGVVPYANVPGRGPMFLLQDIRNGTRMGKLSDFGGRREKCDVDYFATAARELCEETGNAFGDAHTIAEDMRSQATVRILNRSGKYVCFFHKVPYVDASELSELEMSPNDGVVTRRECRWWRADELIGHVDDSQLLERMMTVSTTPPPPLPSRKKAARSARQPRPSADAPSSPAAAARATPQPLSSFHKALFKTLTIYQTNPYAKERWHATVMDTITAAERQKAAASAADQALHEALARVTRGRGLDASGSSSPRRAARPRAARSSSSSSSSSSKPRVPLGDRSAVRRAEAKAKRSGVAKRRGSRANAPASSEELTSIIAPKRGSRRGPPKAARKGDRDRPAWVDARREDEPRAKAAQRVSRWPRSSGQAARLRAAAAERDAQRELKLLPYDDV